jgi:hypothetical protein
MLDELFPIEDSILMTQHGSIKDTRYVHLLNQFSRNSTKREGERKVLTHPLFESRFYPDLKHMGEPVARKVILEWLNKLFKSIPPSICDKTEAKTTPLLNGYGH